VSYTVRIAAPPVKFLEKLRDSSLQRRLTQCMRKLGENPRPPGCVKLAGPDPLYRIRSGDYRIIYQIRDSELLVVVVAIGHRREIYR
jgi:mRNA interferase RelE/StbE